MAFKIQMMLPTFAFKEVPVGEFFQWHDNIMLKIDDTHDGTNAIAISSEGEFFRGEPLSFELDDAVMWMDAELKLFAHKPTT